MNFRNKKQGSIAGKYHAHRRKMNGKLKVQERDATGDHMKYYCRENNSSIKEEKTFVIDTQTGLIKNSKKIR